MCVSVLSRKYALFLKTKKDQQQIINLSFFLIGVEYIVVLYRIKLTSSEAARASISNFSGLLS